jgi:uncharacterized protein YgiM (DUF1202 family)
MKIKHGFKTTNLQEEIAPQAKISADFSLHVVPQAPKFETSHDLGQTEIIEKIPKNLEKASQIEQQLEITLLEKEQPLISKILKITALVLAFAIALFATQHYLRNYTPIFNQSKQLIGISTTDVNIRPSAGTQEPPIGLLPKGSKVRILDAKDNWYLIDVVEYSRPKNNQKDADKGWVSKKYIEIQGG